MKLIKLGYLGLLMYAIAKISLISAGCSPSVPLEPVLVDIKGIDKAVLIRKFFNRTPIETAVMMPDRAVHLLEETGGKLGKVSSKKLNIDVSGDMMDVAPYNKIYGVGKAEEIINAVREERDTK